MRPLSQSPLHPELLLHGRDGRIHRAFLEKVDERLVYVENPSQLRHGRRMLVDPQIHACKDVAVDHEKARRVLAAARARLDAGAGRWVVTELRWWRNETDTATTPARDGGSS